jgi:LPXTG-site transpeptidase (sortase) family protein
MLYTIKANMSKLSLKILNKRFIILWLIVFLVLFLMLYNLGFAPEGILAIGEKDNFFANNDSASLVENLGIENNGIVSTNELNGNSFRESRITVGDINLDAPIVHPESVDINTLNTAIAQGVAHYPGSGEPGEVGNVFLFGHSTNLRIVNNQNYAVFNRLKELKAGAMIRIESDGNEYWYVVKSVSLKKADETWINLATSKKLLTISTCNVFGAKEDRYVVEAEFARKYPLVK